jgi:EAL domain-containing protein (putative c-di-GMP-specific phosphodiesterase class I)
MDTASDVLRGADLAMYEAKRGRRAVGLFHRDLDRRAARRLELESDLRAALERGDFQLHYQPIVSLADGRARRLEALIRWNRGRRDLVSPVEFIPVAEETGLIVELGAWVLVEACRTAAGLGRSAGELPGISVNLSPRQLLEPGLDRIVQDALDATHLPADRLTLEITESVLLSDAGPAVERLSNLRRMGVRVAIDDFGTGYSSLGYLRGLPLDEVKIDRSFIVNLGEDRRQAALVRAIVELCRALGLTTVAEGVETEDQARRVLELGCELAQGFHLGMPASVDEIAGLFREAPARLPVATRGQAKAGRGHLGSTHTRATEARGATRVPAT